MGPASGQFSSALTNAAVTCFTPVGDILARVSRLGDCTLGGTGVLKEPMGQDRVKKSTFAQARVRLVLPVVARDEVPTTRKNSVVSLVSLMPTLKPPPPG